MNDIRAAARWYSRGVLGAVTLLLLMISAKFLLDPIGSAAPRGIALNTPLGVSIARVGFGGFPLACAIIAAWCVVTAGRVRLGLQFVVTLFSTVLVVRIVAALVDSSVAGNARLIGAEVVFLALALTALRLESR